MSILSKYIYPALRYMDKKVAKIMTTTCIGVTIAIVFFWTFVAFSPLPLDFAKGYFQDRLSQTQIGYDVDYDRAFLTWSAKDTSPAIRLSNLRIKDAQHSIVLEAPVASFIISWTSFLRASIIPSALFFQGLSLHFTLPDKSPDKNHEANAISFIKRLSKDLPLLAARYEKWRKSIPSSTLEVGIRDSILSLDAYGQRWQWSLVELSFLRQKNTLRANADMNFLRPSCALIDSGIDPGIHSGIDPDQNINDAPIVNQWRMSYQHADNGDDATLDIDFSTITPAHFASCSKPRLAWLSGLDLPIDGTLQSKINADGHMHSIAVDIIAGQGEIDIQGNDAETPKNGKKTAQRQSIRNATMRLMLNRPSASTDDIFFTATAQDTIFDLTAHGKMEGESYILQGDATVQDIPIAMIKRLWPKHMAQPTRNWFTVNMNDGKASRAHIDFAIHMPNTDSLVFAIHRLEGNIDFSAVSVDYVDGMPPARNIEATAVFNTQRFDISVLSATVGDLPVHDGWVYLYDLDTDIELADIILPIAGPLKDLIDILDHPPLRARERMEIDQPITIGRVDGQARFQFPLRKDLVIDDVALSAQGRLENLDIRDFVNGNDLNDAMMDISLDRKGMHLSGHARIGTIPAKVTAYYDFLDDENGLERRYQAHMTLDSRHIDTVGLSSYLDGRIGVDLTIESFINGTDRTAAIFDLEHARMALPMIDWEKPEGDAASLSADITTDDEGDTATVTRAVFTGATLKARGKGTLEADGRPRMLTIEDFVLDGEKATNRGQLRLDWRSADRIDATLDAAAIDLSPYFSLTDTPDEPTPTSDNPVDFTLSFHIASLQLPAGKPLRDAIGRIHSQRGILRHIEAKAAIDDKHSVRVRATHKSDTSMRLDLTSNDGGALMERLDLYHQIRGGDLNLQGIIAQDKITGVMKMRDYAVHESPLFLQLLSLPSLTGIFNRLTQDESMPFDRLRIPFDLDGNTLTLTDASMSNSSLGITFSGTLDTKDDMISMRGEVIPAYTLNSILSNIPILGTILTDNQKRNALAASYSLSGTSEDPKVALNPLSALTPGIFRRIFDLFSAPDTDAADPSDPPDTLKRTPF